MCNFIHVYEKSVEPIWDASHDYPVIILYKVTGYYRIMFYDENGSRMRFFHFVRYTNDANISMWMKKVVIQY